MRREAKEGPEVLARGRRKLGQSQEEMVRKIWGQRGHFRKR